MYKSRYKRRKIVQREVSWEVPHHYIATSSIGRRTKAKNIIESDVKSTKNILSFVSHTKNKTPSSSMTSVTPPLNEQLNEQLDLNSNFLTNLNHETKDDLYHLFQRIGPPSLNGALFSKNDCF